MRLKGKYFRQIFLICTWVLAITANAHAQVADEIYLKSGEFISGEILAVGTDVLLVKAEDRIFSVKRADIKYVFKEPREYIPPGTYVPPRPVGSYQNFNPLDRFYLVEISGGLYTFSNFALSMQFTQWLHFNPKWSAGFCMSLDFSRYVMWRASLHTRRFIPMNEEIKSYVTLGIGAGPQSGYFINSQRWNVVDYEFSTVLQGNLGAGIWYDTGSGVVFTGEGGLSFHRFHLSKSFLDAAGETRTQRTSAFNVGPYFRVGMVF